ncbi:hypothetical protein BOH73_21400, partial [Pseudomonas versuta]
MQFRRVVWLAILLIVVLLIGTSLGVLVWHNPQVVGFKSGSERQAMGLWVIGATTLLLVMCIAGYHLLGQQLGRSAYREVEADNVPPPAPAGGPESEEMGLLKAHLRDQYGLFWRYKVRLLLVVGEPAEIEAVAPTLAAQKWLEGQGTVLLWGGSALLAAESFQRNWAGLSRWRALDGVVWALTAAHYADDGATTSGARQLQSLARSLHWQLPLYLWQVCESAWPQPSRKLQEVGCRLPARDSAAALETALNTLLEPLRREGLEQMNTDRSHDFLLRLSRDLQVGGIARWRCTLARLAACFGHGVPLRGLWFSLPLAAP